MTAQLEVGTFTVGPFAENAYIVRRQGSDRALLVDPGAEAPRLIEALSQLGVGIEAILVTHTHVDHIGAVAALAAHTGAPVYCPQLEREDLATGITLLGEVAAHDPEFLLVGGEQLELADLEIGVIFTPGHSAGHLTYAIPEARALFSGDVLFQGSVGRTDLPGGDWPTLRASIAQLIDAHPPETRVHPGHMSITTLGHERETNPFLSDLRVPAPR